MIGISALTQAAALVFAPLAALLLVAYGGYKSARVWRSALAVVFAAGLLVSPWTMRNYLMFGEFVPVKTGLGFIADLTNPSLAETFRRFPGANPGVEPPWTSGGPGEVWSVLTRAPNKRFQFYE